MDRLKTEEYGKSFLTMIQEERVQDEICEGIEINENRMEIR